MKDFEYLCKVWAPGVVHPEPKQILLSLLRNRHVLFETDDVNQEPKQILLSPLRNRRVLFETEDVNQLRKDTFEFGQNAAGGKAVVSGFRIWKANAQTALPMDYAAERKGDHSSGLHKI